MWWSMDKLTVASAHFFLFFSFYFIFLDREHTHIYHSFSIPYKMKFSMDKLAHASIKISPLYLTLKLYIRKLIKYWTYFAICNVASTTSGLQQTNESTGKGVRTAICIRMHYCFPMGVPGERRQGIFLTAEFQA